MKKFLPILPILLTLAAGGCTVARPISGANGRFPDAQAESAYQSIRLKSGCEWVSENSGGAIYVAGFTYISSFSSDGYVPATIELKPQDSLD
jgi:hypothetical protein